MNDYVLQKTRIASLEDTLAGQQVESKASRDTIVKLVSEAEKRKKNATGIGSEVKSLKKERDEALLAKKNADREKEILLEKLKENHKEWGSFQKELMEKDKQITDLDRTVRTSDYEAKASFSLHQGFISQLATILSNSCVTVPRTEEAIKERILEIYGSEQKLKSVNEELKKTLERLAKQLDQQRDLYHEAVTKSYKAEEQLQENKDSIKHLKGKLASEEMIKDGFNTERKMLKKFLTQLSEKLNMGRDISTESLVSQYELLTSKAEEISKWNKEFGSNSKTLVYNLQKKEKNNQQRKTIEELSRSLQKLDKIKEKAAKKVVSLKTELDYSEHEHMGDVLRNQHLVDSVTNELHTAKRALEEVARREKQLVDFRETITRMMGFNLNTLAVPDYEIFDQLKSVLRAHGPVNENRIDRSKLPYGFRTGGGEQEYTVQHVNSLKNPRF
uniref:Uncharacterized protein n=1 Tax=Leptobrachium leishanense TaxID=445787 RepID=A0A8C5MSB3_9ANUR